MKKLLKNLTAMREGATLVTVVIATAFLVAVGAIILSASTKYLVSVYMDRNTNENLYDAEGVLDEVRAGLLEYAGESGEEAYKNILENYDTYAGRIRSEFGKQYICGIVSRIDTANTNYTWSDAEDPALTGKSLVGNVELETLRKLTKAKGASGSQVVTSKANLKALLAGEQTSDDEDKSSSKNNEDENINNNPDDGSTNPESSDDQQGTGVSDASTLKVRAAGMGFTSVASVDTTTDIDTNTNTDVTTDVTGETTDPNPGTGEGESSETPTTLGTGEGETEDPSSLTTGDKNGEGTAETSETSTVDDELEKSEDVKYVINYSPTKGYYLTIKNLFIDFQGEGGYRSTIKTDIQFTVPDYRFEGDDTVSASKDFLIISDGELNVTNGASLSGDGARFDGNIYTGGGVIDEETIDNTGIKIDSDAKAHFNCEKLITRGSLDVYTGADVTVAGASTKEVSLVTAEGVTSASVQDSSVGDIYVKNIKLLKKDGLTSSETPANKTKFTLNANSYVENDLDIRDIGATVTLGGKYFGYSYNEQNTSSNLATKAEYSSAILVNGFNTTIKTENLKKLILSGRAFVSRDGSIQDTADIVMGESVAVRSNQLAYLVPDKYVIFEHNPITVQETKEVADANYTEPLSLIRKDELLKSDIGPYLNTNKPVTGNYGQATDNGSGYVFLYLNFDNQEAANKYFKHFYKDGLSVPEVEEGEEQEEVFTKDDLNDRALSYISSASDGGIKLSPALFLVAGNIIHDYYATDGAQFQSANYFENNGLPSDALLLDGKKIGLKYVNYQTVLSANGNATSMRLLDTKNPSGGEGAKVSKMVDGTMIKFANIPEIKLDDKKVEAQTGAKVYSNPGNAALTVDTNYLGKPEASEPGSMMPSRCLIVNGGDVILNHDCAGLVIAKGDVSVSADFTGLIISGGKVTITEGKSLKSDQVLIDKLLEYAQSDETLSKIFAGLTNPITHNTTEVDKCIRYLNWTKNYY